MQVDPIKLTLNVPDTQRLKLKCYGLLSHVAFVFNLRRYTKQRFYPQCEPCSGLQSTAGAYTRPLFSSTCAVSVTKYTQNTPYYPLTPAKHPLSKCTPYPTKPFTLSRQMDECKPLVRGGAHGRQKAGHAQRQGLRSLRIFTEVIYCRLGICPFS